MINIRLDYVLLDKRMKLKDLAEATGLAVNNLSVLKTNKARAVRFSTLNSLPLYSLNNSSTISRASLFKANH